MQAIRSIILGIFVISCNNLISQHTKLYDIELLDYFKVELTKDSFQVIHNKVQGKNIAFIINDSKKNIVLPTYKDFIVYNPKCQLKQLGVQSRYFGSIQIPIGKFLIMAPEKISIECP